MLLFSSMLITEFTPAQFETGDPVLGMFRAVAVARYDEERFKAESEKLPRFFDAAIRRHKLNDENVVELARSEKVTRGLALNGLRARLAYEHSHEAHYKGIRLAEDLRQLVNGYIGRPAGLLPIEEEAATGIHIMRTDKDNYPTRTGYEPSVTGRVARLYSGGLGCLLLDTTEDMKPAVRATVTVTWPPNPEPMVRLAIA
jgi:hypothetical protein